MVNQLQRLGVPVLGVVANFVDHTPRSYDGYSYGGGAASIAASDASVK
jgi:Mrp family chromosome partitioning ATPase